MRSLYFVLFEVILTPAEHPISMYCNSQGDCTPERVLGMCRDINPCQLFQLCFQSSVHISFHKQELKQPLVPLLEWVWETYTLRSTSPISGHAVNIINTDDSDWRLKNKWISSPAEVIISSVKFFRDGRQSSDWSYYNQINENLIHIQQMWSTLDLDRLGSQEMWCQVAEECKEVADIWGDG